MDKHSDTMMGAAVLLLMGMFVFAVLVSLGVGFLTHSVGIGCLTAAGFVVLYLLLLIGAGRRASRAKREGDE